jgi:threonine/homoserine/homoserine lactone efflux protein
MPLVIFLSEAVLISLSGVMAPGPMTTVAVGKGNETPYAGAWLAVGHAIVEIPLMIAVFYGVGYVLNLPHVQAIIAFVGGVFLLFMGVSMLRSIKQGEVGAGQYAGSPVIAGVLLSIGNPYFLVWWATVGATLILRSGRFGLWGFGAFALLHWLCDFLWCYFLSALSYRGGQFFGKRFQQIVFSICGVLLLFFSGKLVVDAVGMLSV